MPKYQIEFKELYNTFDKLIEYKNHLELSDELIKYFSDNRSWIKRLESPEFFVAFVGVFSAGKSVIINALLNNYILPEDVNPLTAAPTIIRKSKDGTTKAIVNYINEDDKKELQNLYIQNILKEMHKDAEFDKFKDKDIKSSISLLKIMDNQREFDKTSLNYEGIELLDRNWNEYKNTSENIDIKNLKKYVSETDENNSKNSRPIFIKNVEIYLNDTDIGEDTVLVDLPGIGVANPLHIKATKNYIENEAKAFIFAAKTMTGISSDQNLKLITDINQKRPDVINNAFWVFNQWDTMGDSQRKSSIEGFKKECEDKNLKFSNERLYRVSALLYLMAEYHQKGKLVGSELYKKHEDLFNKEIGNLVKPEDISEKIETEEYLKEFKKFKTDLIHYLSTKARADFEQSSKNSLINLSKALLKNLHGKYKNIEHPEQIEDNLLNDKSNEIFNSYNKLLINLIESSIAESKENVSNKIFWDTKSETQLINDIKNQIKKIDKDKISKDMRLGAPIEMKSRLSGLINDEIEEIDLYKLIEQKFISFFNDNFSDSFVRSLREKLQVDSKYMPEELQEFIDLELDSQVIQNRLKGISSVLLIDFEKVLDELLSRVGNTNQLKVLVSATNDIFSNSKATNNSVRSNSDIESAIQLVEDGICMYIQNLGNNANAYVIITINRYLIAIEKNIKRKIADQENKIRNKIRNETKSRIKESLAPEINRFKAFNEAKISLTKIIDEIS